MKPLHKQKTIDPLRRWTEFAQVKNGKVCMGNGHMLAIMPVEEVFGKDLISPDEEFYFEKRLWGIAKFDKATTITRDGLIFTASNAKTLGTIIALQKETFENEIAKFPEWPPVVPDSKSPLTAVDVIGFDFVKLNELLSAFGLNSEKWQYYFRGANKVIIIKHPDTKGFGLLMPVSIADLNYPETETSEEIVETADDLL